MDLPSLKRLVQIVLLRHLLSGPMEAMDTSLIYVRVPNEGNPYKFEVPKTAAEVINDVASLFGYEGGILLDSDNANRARAGGNLLDGGRSYDFKPFQPCPVQQGI
jgi:hypothetical protein